VFIPQSPKNDTLWIPSNPSGPFPRYWNARICHQKCKKTLRWPKLRNSAGRAYITLPDLLWWGRGWPAPFGRGWPLLRRASLPLPHEPHRISASQDSSFSGSGLATDLQVQLFLSHVSTAMLARDIDVAILSVCPSVTLRYCIKRLNTIIFSSAYASPVILVFPVLNIFAKFRHVHARRGRWIQVRCHAGLYGKTKIVGLPASEYDYAIVDRFPHICLYVRNGTREGLGTVIGNHVFPRTVILPMTLSELSRSFLWPTYCCVHVQLTRNLLAIVKFVC